MLGLNPNGFSRGYYFVHLVCRFVLYIFFRKVAIVHADFIPMTGGIVLCGTHNNQFVDAMVWSK